MCDNSVSVVARKPLVDVKTGLPIDGIDGTECPCPAPLPADAQAEFERNRQLNHQMVGMGGVVGGSSVRMDLPSRVKEDDDRED